MEELFPLGMNFRYTFLYTEDDPGFVLFCEIDKTPDVRVASDGIAYLRRGAQNLPQTTPDQITRLQYSKGIVSFEDQLVNNDVDVVANSTPIIGFALEIVPSAEPESWLSKQRLIEINVRQ
jgi:ATP-dependent DNA helicase RecG